MNKNLNEIFPEIYEEQGKLYTKSIAPGTKVYGEKILNKDNSEYRQWDLFRSKLSAAIKNGLEKMPIRKGSKILYLGAAEGTTISHVSDIVGKEGTIFGVDVSERVMRKFIEMCEQRENVVPIIADANKPWTYKDFLAETKIDLLYQDVAQQNQAQIFLKNAEYFLRKGSQGMLVIKAKSISQQDPGNVFRKELGMLSQAFKVKQIVNLKPFEKDHVLASCERI